jgi:hypothetical protein
MSNHLRRALALSALCFGLAAAPANALTSRSTNFLFGCEGLAKHVNLNFGNFGVGSAQEVLGAQIALFDNKTEGASGRSAIQYIILRVGGDPQKQLLIMGILQNSAQALFPFDGYQVNADAQGQVLITLDGACNGGFQQIQGNVTVFFK